MATMLVAGAEHLCLHYDDDTGYGVTTCGQPIGRCDLGPRDEEVTCPKCLLVELRNAKAHAEAAWDQTRIFKEDNIRRYGEWCRAADESDSLRAAGRELLQGVHDAKGHAGSIQLCKAEPCLAMVPLFSEPKPAEGRKP